MQQVQFNPLIALRRRESAPLYSVLCTWRSLVAGVILLVDARYERGFDPSNNQAVTASQPAQLTMFHI
jgi:hypothetical protein